MNIYDKYPTDYEYDWSFKYKHSRWMAFGRLVELKVFQAFQALGYKVEMSPRGSILDVGLKVDMRVSLDEDLTWTDIQVKSSYEKAYDHLCKHWKGINLHKKLGIPGLFPCPPVVVLSKEGKLLNIKENKIVVVTSKGLEAGEILTYKPELFVSYDKRLKLRKA